jgi:hypothetical protein
MIVIWGSGNLQWVPIPIRRCCVRSLQAECHDFAEDACCVFRAAFMAALSMSVEIYAAVCFE